MEISKFTAGGDLNHDHAESRPEAQLDALPQVQADDLSIASDGGCCVLKSSSFSGRLRFEGAARIECQVGGTGEIHGTGTITVAEGAMVMAPIRAASILIAGKVRADITASERIEVGPSGNVSGRLTAPIVVVRENAQVEGRFTMAPSRRP
jgi:cytoskeletal protein CcmA (bactofilin family)